MQYSIDEWTAIKSACVGAQQAVLLRVYREDRSLCSRGLWFKGRQPHHVVV
jgi:hypothetical protein